MSIPWTSETEARFQHRMARQTQEACKAAAFLALTLFPTFSLIDWFAQHDHIAILNFIRYIAVSFFLMIFLIVRKKKQHWNPYGWCVALLSIAALDITCMTLALGGYKSPYYAGVNLVILGAGLLFPWDVKRMGLFVVWLWALYFLPVLIHANFQIDDIPVFVNNAAFILSTGIITITSAHFSYGLRRELFAQVIQAEEAQKRAETFNRAKNEATQALEMRDEFISIASHELKTPITVLKLQNDLLSRFLGGVSLPKEQHQMFAKHFSRSNGQLKSLIRLIDDMLDLSRITSGKLDFNLNLHDLGELIRDAADRLSENIAESGIHLELDLQSEVFGSFDRVRMEQVVTNLLTNAIKYAPGAPLKIRMWERNHRATIEVKDQGPGIAMELQQKVFDRFARGDSNHKIGGLGLGLYIAQQIIEGQHGHISVESEPGQGACFRIELPLNGAALAANQ